MSAILKIFTDSGHTSEVAHTTRNSSTVSCASGATALSPTSTTNWPTSGTIDIIDGTNGNETLTYYGLSGGTLQLTTPTAHAHTAVTINQWDYVLNVGDQTNGIPNDGSVSTPVAANTGTWYVYNAGDQTAQSPTISTNNAAPSTTAGYADTQISITSSTTGFATSVSPASIAAGSQVQMWVVEEVPNGQNIANNPQQCVIQMSYSTL